MQFESSKPLLSDQNADQIEHQIHKENSDLFKTATFFDPENKKRLQKRDESEDEKLSDQQPSNNNTFIPGNNFKQSQTPPINKNLSAFQQAQSPWNNNYAQNVNSPKEKNINDRNLVVPQINYAQSIHSSSNRKRPLLAFQLSPSSTRTHQTTTTDDKIQESDFDFIQSVQDAEFWNKVNLIISENDETNNNNNKNSAQGGRLVTLPSINQKREIVKKQDKYPKKKLLMNHASMVALNQEKISSCSTRDSIRQNNQQPKTFNQLDSQLYNQQQQNNNLSTSQSSALLKKQQYPTNGTLFNQNLNNSSYKPNLNIASQSVSLNNNNKNLQNSLLNQYSSYQDSIQTEESGYIFSPEQQKLFGSPSQDSFHQLSSQSTNQSSLSRGVSNLTQSQSLSLFNSQVQNASLSQNQPYFSNNLIMRSKSPTNSDNFLINQQNTYLTKKQNHTQNEISDLANLQNNQSQQLSLQSERQLLKETMILPQSILKNSLHVPLKQSTLQQRVKREGMLQQSVVNNNQNELNGSQQSQKKSFSIQSHKLLSSYKNDETMNLAQETKKRLEWKQNILLKDNILNQLNFSIKKQYQDIQFQSPTPADRLNTLQNMKMNYDINDNYQYLKCDENITAPSLQIPSSSNQVNSHRQLSQENCFFSNQTTKNRNMQQSNFKIEDPFRRSMQQGLNGMKEDFSFSEEPNSNNIQKISQSAQGYREQAKKINLRSKQQENLVKKLFKIDEKSTLANNSLSNNYFNSDLSSSYKTKKQIKFQNHQ